MNPSTKKVRWGVLSTANIGLKKVIPGMQAGELCEIAAIASRELATAQKAATALNIPKAYGSYEELLADPEIDAVYNPLPNDLHVEWSIRAAEAGKHVLCEKPIGMNVADAQKLIAVRDRLAHEGRPVKIGEAFMVRLHPQWIRAQELISAGRIGELRLVQGAFSYFNIKPENIRNNRAAGGGALMDIGCYLIFLSRFLFRREPARVLALINRDPTFQTDRLTSMILDFTAADGEPAQAIASCSTQLIPHQRIQVFGARGRIEIEIPVNVPPDRPVNLLLDERGDLFGAGIVTESFPPSGSTPDHGSGNGIDQYTLQGDAFSRAILTDTEAPVPLEEALRNMAVIDALFRSAKTNAWEKP